MIPLARNIKRYFSFKEFVIVLIAVVVSISVGVVFFLNVKKEVAINDDGKIFAVKTMKSTVKEVLEQNGIAAVSQYDIINVPLDRKLQKMRKNIITIERAISVNVYADGQEKTLMTCKDTIGEALNDNLSNLDKLDGGLKREDKIVKGMSIKVIRVKEEVVAEQIPIAYDIINRENNHLDKGSTLVVKDGKEGMREKRYQVVKEDGTLVFKNLIKDSILLAPITKVIEFGTVLNFKTSRGEVVRYRKVMDMRATAYTASYEDTGKREGDPGFGITYTGMRAREGVIAVDPRVIPLGSKVYVEGIGKTPTYGFAIAGDIGGAIKRDLIDLYFDSSKAVSRWGCKKVRVYILTE